MNLSSLKRVSPASAALLGALVVLTPLYVWAVYMPLADRLAAAGEEVARQRAKIEQFASLQAGFHPAGVAEKAEWAKVARTFRQAVPQDPALVDLVGQVSLIARRAGIREASFKPLPEARALAGEPRLAGAAVEVGFRASYRQVACLLAGLSRVERLMAIEQMEIRQQEDEAGLAVRLVLVGYYLRGEGCSPTATS